MISIFGLLHVASSYLLQSRSEKPLIWAGLISATSIGYYFLGYYKLKNIALVSEISFFWGILALAFAGLSTCILQNIMRLVPEDHAQKQWLIFGIILLLFGALQQNQSIRIASLVVMILTVEKYFSMTHQSLLDCCVYSLSLALDSVGFMHSLFSESVKNSNLLNMAKYQITTPRKNKESIDILYGYHSTTFGKALIGVTAQSICHLSFCDFETSAIGILEKEWSQACLKEDRLTTEKIVHNIFDIQIPERSFSLLVKGTDFQIKVWQALLSIPKGTTTAYENIAHIIDKPKAVRATANAIANNPISYLIPCHRVIRKSGEINKYRWGIEPKKAILAYELNFMRHNINQ